MAYNPYKSLDELILELDKIDTKNIIQCGVTNNISQEVRFYDHERKYKISYAPTLNMKYAINKLLTNYGQFCKLNFEINNENNGFVYVIHKNPQYSIFDKLLDYFVVN